MAYSDPNQNLLRLDRYIVFIFVLYEIFCLFLDIGLKNSWKKIPSLN